MNFVLIFLFTVWAAFIGLIEGSVIRRKKAWSSGLITSFVAMFFCLATALISGPLAGLWSSALSVFLAVWMVIAVICGYFHPSLVLKNKAQ